MTIHVGSFIHILNKQRMWKPLSKSAAGIETRDISGGFESSFVQVCDIPKGTSLDSVKPKLISDAIFGTTGKFGYVVIMNLNQVFDFSSQELTYLRPFLSHSMYGSPTDVRIKKLSSGGDGNTALYQATFTTLTPAMRERYRTFFCCSCLVWCVKPNIFFAFNFAHMHFHLWFTHVTYIYQW